jgi:hypothetical protein
MVTAAKIGQLTDVSHCKLHQHLYCNSKIKRQTAWPDPAGRPPRAESCQPGAAPISLVRKPR